MNELKQELVMVSQIFCVLASTTISNVVELTRHRDHLYSMTAKC